MTAVGFVDYGFAAANSDKVVILGLLGTENGDFLTADITKENIGKEIANKNGQYYVTDLTRPLNFLTNGNPSAVEQKFIDFATAPSNDDAFTEQGYFSIFGLAKI